MILVYNLSWHGHREKSLKENDSVLEHKDKQSPDTISSYVIYNWRADHDPQKQ